MTAPVLPAEQWRPATPVLRSTPDARSPEQLRAVARQFDVEHAARYQPGGGKTWCNIFLWDVTSALGAEIPHWVNFGGGPAEPGHGMEQSANSVVRWLQDVGGAHGWVEVDEATARADASAGRPAVAVWANPLPNHSGHVALVLPDQPGVTGPVIAQAGARNYAAAPLARGFGPYKPRYFTHA